MNKINLLYSIIAILVAMNIAMLIFFISLPPKHHPDRNRNLIIKRLHFDETQILKYDSLIKIHRREINGTQDKIMSLKNILYQQLTQHDNASKVDSLINEITFQQSNIEHIHYNHFLAIKKMCNPEQIENYRMLTAELSRMFAQPMPKHK